MAPIVGSITDMKKILILSAAIIATSYLAVCAFFWLSYPEDTRYASGYSEKEFSDLDKGMTRAMVYEKLGLPLELEEYSEGVFIRRTTIDGTIEEFKNHPPGFLPTPVTKYVASYSEPGMKHPNYHIRLIIMDGNEKVIDKFADFYTD